MKLNDPLVAEAYRQTWPEMKRYTVLLGGPRDTRFVKEMRRQGSGVRVTTAPVDNREELLGTGALISLVGGEGQRSVDRRTRRRRGLATAGCCAGRGRSLREDQRRSGATASERVDRGALAHPGKALDEDMGRIGRCDTGRLEA